MEEFTIKYLVYRYPELTESMIRNYRSDSKLIEGAEELGRNKDGEVVFNQKEVDFMLEKSVNKKLKMEEIMFNYIKSYPGILTSQLEKFMYKYCNNEKEDIIWTKERTANILADLSDMNANGEHSKLYEDDDDSLYVIGYSKRKRRKSKKSGLFYEEL